MRPLSLVDLLVIIAATIFISMWTGIDHYLDVAASDDGKGEEPETGPGLAAFGIIVGLLILTTFAAALFVAISWHSLKASFLNEAVPILSRNRSHVMCSGWVAFAQGIVTMLIASAPLAIALFLSFRLSGKIRVCLLMLLAILLVHF